MTISISDVEFVITPTRLAMAVPLMEEDCEGWTRFKSSKKLAVAYGGKDSPELRDYLIIKVEDSLVLVCRDEATAKDDVCMVATDPGVWREFV